MALTDQPYLPLFVDDWMNNSKLKMCSPGAHGLMISIMCLMHKSEEYGVILLRQKYQQNTQQDKNFAAQIAKLSSFDLPDTEKYFAELIDEKVLKIEGEKLVCRRMVNDANTSKKRALSGRKGGVTTNLKSKNFATANLPANTGIESGVGIVIVNEPFLGKEGVGEKPNPAIPAYDTFLKEALIAMPDVDENHVRITFDNWVDNGWKDASGKPIKSWKSLLLYSVTTLKKKNLTPAGPVIAGRQTEATANENFNTLMGYGKE